MMFLAAFLVTIRDGAATRVLHSGYRLVQAADSAEALTLAKAALAAEYIGDANIAVTVFETIA